MLYDYLVNNWLWDKKKVVREEFVGIYNVTLHILVMKVLGDQ